MDSMRSLNTSLPRTRRAKPPLQPDLHQSFRTAALTVTNLYKSALAECDNARAEGYQDALEEILDFLDKESLGMEDGEGRRIRKWVNERFDKAPQGPANSDSEDELDEKRARSSSPIMERQVTPEDTRSSEAPAAETALRSDSAPPPVQDTPEVNMTPPQGPFHFTSPHAFPSSNATDTSTSTAPASRRNFSSSRRSSARPSRSMQRAAAANLFSLGNGAGQKRKLMQEFFNIDGFNDRRDGTGGAGGGSKRGRLS